MEQNKTTKGQRWEPISGTHLTGKVTLRSGIQDVRELPNKTSLGEFADQNEAILFADFLNTHVFKNDPKASPNDLGLRHVLVYVRCIHFLGQISNTVWVRERELSAKIEAALDTLLSSIPELADISIRQNGTLEFAENTEGVGAKIPASAFAAHKARREKQNETLAELQNTILKVKASILPLIVMPPEATDMRWTVLAHGLMHYFSVGFPTSTTASRYRFVQMVAPKLTGEKPTLEAVRTFFMRKRRPSVSRRQA